jgi:hypothetical protein
MDLNLTPYFTFQGDLIFGDTDAQKIPLVRMSFHGPCASLTAKGKLELVRQLAEHLTDLVPDVPVPEISH